MLLPVPRRFTLQEHINLLLLLPPPPQRTCSAVLSLPDTAASKASLCSTSFCSVTTCSSKPHNTQHTAEHNSTRLAYMFHAGEGVAQAIWHKEAVIA
jgi:hypothetical protein